MTESLEDRARRRVKKLGQSDIIDWTTACLSGMMRHIELYQRGGDEAHLAEISVNLGTLNAMVDELVVRKEAQNEEDSPR